MKKILVLAILSLFCHFNGWSFDVNFYGLEFDGNRYLVIKSNYDEDFLFIDEGMVKFYLNDGSVFRIHLPHFNQIQKKNYYRVPVTPEMEKAFQIGVKVFTVDSMPKIYRQTLSEKEAKQLYESIIHPEENESKYLQ